MPPIISSIPAAIKVGASFNINGSHFSAKPLVNFFVSGVSSVAASPLKPSFVAPTLLTVPIPVSVPMGEGFATVQVVNTDQGFKASNLASALLQGSALAGIPTITTINGTGLAPSSSDPGFGINNVETVLIPGTVVKVGGTGFDTVNGIAVDVFCNCSGSRVGPFFLKPGDPGLSSTEIRFTLPATGVRIGPSAIVIHNAGPSKSYEARSNAVEMPIGERISVTSVSQSGSTVTVTGTGFVQAVTVINFFNATPSGVVNLGGLAATGVGNIPLSVVSPHQFSFTVPAHAVPGAAYVQALNSPFVPFSSSGNDPRGAFTLK